MASQDRIPEKLGPYRLQDRLGEGGMGAVYLARDRERRPVAIKVLHSRVAVEPTARRRLAREVEAMRRVRSPFVAEVIDADVDHKFPYIVTRYVPGETLDDTVARAGPADPRRAGTPGQRAGSGPDGHPRGWDRAPRPQARQRDAAQREPGGHRLRHRPVRRRFDPADPDRDVHGHARLPGPRGHRGPAEQCGVRRALLGRHDGLRRHRPRPVRHRVVRERLLPHRAGAGRHRRHPRPAGPAGGGHAQPGPAPPAHRELAVRSGRDTRPGRGPAPADRRVPGRHPGPRPGSQRDQRCQRG